MIKKYEDGSLIEKQSLIEALEIGEIKSPVISFIGAGGKTTTIKRLCREYIEKDIPVVVTTTTHLYNEDKPWFYLGKDLKDAKEILFKYNMIWLGSLNNKGKMSIPDEQFLHEMINLGYPVLIEADGARRLPLKSPGENEPVYLGKTTHVVNLYGIDSIGKKIKDISFRPELVASIVDKNVEDLVEEKDLAVLMTDRRAGMKYIDKNIKYNVILNKVDNYEDNIKAKRVVEYSIDKGFYDIVVVGKNLNNQYDC